MKYLSTRNLLLLLCASLIPQGCKKDRNTVKTSFTLISNYSFVPGEFVVVETNKYLKQEAFNSNVGGVTVQLARADSFHYVFRMPLLPPGDYKLSLREMGASESPDVYVDTYSEITDPNAEINSYLDLCRQMITAITAEDYEKVIPAKNLSNLQHLKEQIAIDLPSLSADDLLLLAYQVRALSELVSQFQQDIYATYSASIRGPRMPAPMALMSTAGSGGTDGKPDGMPEDLYMLVKTAESYNLASEISLISAAGAIGLALVPPLSLGFAAGAAALLLATELAEQKARWANYYISIYNIKVNGLSFDYVNNTPRYVSIIENQSSWSRFAATFSTITRATVAGFPSILSDIVNADAKLERLSTGLNGLITTAIKVASKFFNKASDVYVAYESQFSKTPLEKTLGLTTDQSHLKITAISNPDLVVNATDDGVNGLKLEVSNPKDNIDTETPFDITVEYTQPYLNQSITATGQAIFIPKEKVKDPVPQKPKFDPVDLELLYGTWRIASTTFLRTDGTGFSQSLQAEFLTLGRDRKFSGNWSLIKTSGFWMLMPDKTTLTLYGFSNPEIEISTLPVDVVSSWEHQLVLQVTEGLDRDYIDRAYVFMVR